MSIRKMGVGVAISLGLVAGCASESEEPQADEVVTPEVAEPTLAPKTCDPPGLCNKLSQNCKVPASAACNLYNQKCVACR